MSSSKQLVSEKRLLFLTALVLSCLILGSLRFDDWRVTTGVIVGGLLSFLNLLWLKKSTSSLLAEATGDNDGANGFDSALYVLRYAIIAMIVALCAMFKLISVAAALVGLLSFAFAILLEAIIQFYFIIVNREED